MRKTTAIISAIAAWALSSGAMSDIPQNIESMVKDGNTSQAIAALKPLAIAEDADAMVLLADLIIASAASSDQDINTAIQLYEKAVSKGRHDAKASLLAIKHRAATNTHPERAAEILFDAARNGDRAARMMISTNYMYGINGFSRSREKALQWARLAADDADPVSLHFLAQTLKAGGTKEEVEEGARIERMALGIGN